MVGDDIVSDIGGAKQNNIFSIQVRTGKYQESDESGEFLQPDLRINSIADLADVLI
jgi:Predicted sugar phosphatases of the HAD superfamily